MELFRRRSAWQRNNIVMRLGCFLVSASMLVSLVLQPPKAKALLTEASLATSVIWTFMQSAGLSFSGNNAGSQEWIDSCQRWYNKFMESKEDNAGGFVGWLGYDSWSAFLADIRYQKNPTNLGYQMFIPKAISAKLAEFTSWFIGQTGLISGGDAKIISSDSCPVPRTFIDRFIEDVSSSSEVISNKWVFPYFYYGMFDFQGTILYYLACSEKKGSWILDGSTWRVKDVGTSYSAYVYSDGTYNSAPSLKSVYFADGRKNASLGYFTASAGSISVTQPGTYSPAVDDTGDKATVVTIPGLDTEIASINDLLQQILDKLAANEMAATGSVAQQPTPEQPDEEKPDLNGLGLPALGAALVTRFPFSIPWDVVKGIKLVAAPAEAPRWEVDFLAPISGRVGGWKGSTKVVIDMGVYPIIGQVCRWTSMIGFCLILASGTKKLIWTA
jgi:hypothetical protein